MFQTLQFCFSVVVAKKTQYSLFCTILTTAGVNWTIVCSVLFVLCCVLCSCAPKRRGRKRSNWTLSKGQQQLSGKGKPLKLMMEKQEQDTVIIRTRKRKIIEEERIRRSWTNSPQVTFCLKNYLEELHQQHTGQTKVCSVLNYKEEPTTSWQDCCQACQAGRQHGRFPMATNLITDLTDFKGCKEIPRSSWHKLSRLLAINREVFQWQLKRKQCVSQAQVSCHLSWQSNIFKR